MSIEPKSTNIVAPAPEWLISFLRESARKHSDPAPVYVQTSRENNSETEKEIALSRYINAAIRRHCDDVASAKEGKRNQALNLAAYSLGHLVGANALARAEAERALQDASAKCGLWGDGPDSVKATIASGLTAGISKPADLSHVGEKREIARYVSHDPDTGEILEDLPAEAEISLAQFEQNDIGNANRLIQRYGDSLRFVVNVGWHAWDGKRWRRDEGDIIARKYAHQTAKAIFSECAHLNNADDVKKRAKWAIDSGYSARITAMLSQAEPYLALTPDDLDCDPWLFNCYNGTINLKTGELLDHNRLNLITKISPVSYDPKAYSAIWNKTLNDIFDKDDELISFVKRALGYSLTGITRENALFIMHGAGSNGKSVLLETTAEIFGDYSRQCPSDTFVAKDKTGNGMSNDIARLTGARFVSVIETEQNRRLAESLVKQATGGDRITARYMHKEFFEFTPRFKLWFATNHKPRIQGTDHGIWRRIRLLPFNVTFYDADKAAEGAPIKDDQLIDKLKNELPGILACMVQGCLEWQEIGLTSPEKVQTATEEYRASQDRLADFVETCCSVRSSFTCKSSEIYAVYKRWCTQNGDNPLSNNTFGEKLEEKGFTGTKGAKGVRIRKGIAINAEWSDPNPENTPD